jgi:hypothetical protein
VATICFVPHSRVAYSPVVVMTVQVEMTTGATIHTSAGLLMSVSRRRTGSNGQPDEVSTRDSNLASTPMSETVNAICPQVARP